MAYLNKVFLIGNVGKIPEIRVTQNGQKKATFSFATSQQYTDRNTNTKTDKTEWHNIVAWRTMAETLEKLGISKGAALYLEGHLVYRSWLTPEGNKANLTEIELDKFQIIKNNRVESNEINGNINDDFDDCPF